MIVNQSKTGKYRTVVVIGVQRGGTSLVAGVIRELGLPMGKNLGINHEDSAFLPTDFKSILPIIKKRNKEYNVWGWKMPHASEYILETIPHLRNPHIIVVFRNLIATTNSQLKHSDANFSEAFHFSRVRHKQVAEVVEQIKCPLMLADYNHAVMKPSGFIEEIKQFLQLEPSPNQIKSALDFIDPEKGYQFVSFEQWTYSASVSPKVNLDKLEPAGAKRKTIHLDRVNNKLVRVGLNPRVEFAASDNVNNKEDEETYYLSLVCTSAPQSISIRLNTGYGYQEKMTKKIKLHLGRNLIRLRSKRIKGIFVFPEFRGNESTTAGFALLKEMDSYI
jgi:hypothetical protein